MRDRFVRLAATGLGAGYSPVAPGTAGTLVAIPLYLVLAAAGGWAVAAGLVVITVVGVPVSTRMEEITGTKDPKPVVIDEIAGYLVTVLGSSPTLFTVTAGFFIFRFFDVLKPPPVRWFERTLPAGAGVMADDLMAGVYSWITLRLLEKILF